MSLANVSRMELLNKDNYDTWKIQMEAMLIRNDLWAYVNGTLKKPDLTDDENSRKNFDKWTKDDSKAKSEIILSMSPTELKQIKSCVTSREVWIKLEGIYQSKGPARKATLLKKLILQRMEDGVDVRDYMNSFFDAVDKLNEMGVIINSDLLTIMLLYSLPSNFENFRCAIESRDELPTPEILRVKIIEENDARKNETRNSIQNAMFANKKTNKWRCYNNKGTENNNTRENYDQNRRKTGMEKFKFRCHRCRKVGHKASECRSKIENKSANCVENETLLTSETCHISCADGKLKWCLDSGASSHLCKDIEHFVNISDSTCGNLNLANSTSTKIAGKGTIVLTTDILGEYKDITLDNTLHVPDLRTNLLSVGKLTNNGYEVLFRKDNAIVHDSDGNVKLIADRIGDLYYADFKLKTLKGSEYGCHTISETFMQWHRRLGHLNFKDLSESVRNGSILGVNSNIMKEKYTNIDCDVCCQGKMIRNSFPKKSERKTELLEIIHTDVCGPMRVESNGKAKYYVEFIDDHSRWCEVRFIKSKSDVINITKEYIALVQNQRGKNIHCIQSDNGTEYTSKEFDNLLKQHGIIRRLTVPYNPEQNGVAERKNRTLLSTARCLLIQSGLPSSFWAEAVNTANYIRNRCPSKSLNGKTPYEIWTGKPPDVKYFKEFGCKVFCLNRKPGKEKFEDRCKQGIFVGYSEQTKGYRVWLPDEKKIEITRDVKFLEENEIREKSFQDFIPESSVPEENFENLHERIIEYPVISNELPEPENQPENENVEKEALSEINSEEGETVRGRGRPRIMRTGLRGRPRKIFSTIPNVAETIEDGEEINISEVFMKQALSSPDANEWYEAMATEILSILKNDTWILVERPADLVVGSRIVLRNKYKADGTLERRKARLVAQGFTQQPGIHFNQTFAPVARLSSIRLVTAIAAHYGMAMQQLDVTCAYLNGELEETIYMEPPKELPEILEVISRQNRKEISKKAADMLETLHSGDKVCLLKKALYGLRQAGRSWYMKLDKALKECGAKPSSADPCIYSIGQGEDSMLIAVYVDDILIASKHIKSISQLKDKLSNKFEVKDLGNVGYCLGIEFTRSGNKIALSQRSYINDILNRFGMTDAKPVSTPLDPNVKLVKPSEVATADEKKLPYRQLIGALTYLAVSTRPDISFAVSYLSQFDNCYRKMHWTAAKRVLRYLKGTNDMGLVYYPTRNNNLKGYVDADWGNCLEDRRSFTGFSFTLSGCLVSWDAKKQRTVALSSTEAEYMGLTEIAKEAIYFRNFMTELGFKNMAKIQVFNDNMSALKLAENSTFHARSKHIDIRYHFIRQALNDQQFKLYHLSSEDMMSDVLTKSLSRSKHEKCVKMMGLQAI